MSLSLSKSPFFASTLVPTGSLRLPRKIRRELNLAKLPVSQLRMHLQNLKDKPENFSHIVTRNAEGRMVQVQQQDKLTNSNSNSISKNDLNYPSLPKEEELQLISEIYPAEGSESIVIRRKRMHKCLWSCLKQKKWSQVEWLFQQINDQMTYGHSSNANGTYGNQQQVPPDEITFTFLIYGNLITSPKRYQGLQDGEYRRLQQSFKYLEDMKAISSGQGHCGQQQQQYGFHPTLLRLHESFLKNYHDLIEIDATPNRLNLLKSMKTMWEISVHFKRRRMKGLKAFLREIAEQKEKSELLKKIEDVKMVQELCEIHGVKVKKNKITDKHLDEVMSLIDEENRDVTENCTLIGQ